MHTDSRLTADIVGQVIRLAHHAGARNWIPSTSGNFSVRIDASTCAVTASGSDKTQLTVDGVIAAAISGEVWPSTTEVASGSAASAATKSPLARIIDRPRSRCRPGTRVETIARSPTQGASASIASVCAAKRTHTTCGAE